MTSRKSATWLWALPLCIVCLCATVAVAMSACINGDVNEDGACECHSCFVGDSCSEPANRSPKFTHPAINVEISEDLGLGLEVYTVEAYDPDEETCTNKGECPCAAITYQITSGNDESTFWINKNTGTIYLHAPLSPVTSEYQLAILATDGNDHRATVDLHVTTQERLNYVNSLADDLAYVPHHRAKRSVVTLPSDVEFTLTKTGANANLAQVKVGHRIEFQLDVVFPSGSRDMQIELFTPDTDNVIMMLCNVQVVKGSNLVVSGTTDPVMDSRNNDNIMDRAVIALQDVDNQASDLITFTPSTLTVTYEAVMLEDAATSDGVQYFVSAGAEYNNANDIWVGQASLEADTTDDSSSFSATPVLDFTGPSTMVIGSAKVFSLAVSLPNPVIDVKVDVYAAVNVSDAMSVCDGTLTSVSDGYKCFFGDLPSSTYDPTYYPDGNSETNGRVHWDLGRPINKLAREDSTVANHKMTFDILVKMDKNEDLVGQDFFVGAAVEIGDTTIWAGQRTVTASADTGSAPAPGSTVSFAVDNQLSQTTAVEIEIELDVPRPSHGAYKLEVALPFQKSQTALQFCGLSIKSTGSNIACVNSDAVLANELVYTDEASKLPDKVIVDLGSIINSDQDQVNAAANKVILTLGIRSTDHEDATISSSHSVTLTLIVNDERQAIGTSSLQVKADDAASSIELETTPTFALSFPSGSDTIARNDVGKLQLKVTTTPDFIYKPFNIEFIMPNSSGSSLLSICGVEMISTGSNIKCLLKEAVKKDVTLVSSFDDGNQDRAVLNLPVLCTVNVSDAATANEIVLEATVLVTDHSDFDSDANTWLSAGALYADSVPSKSNLWVGQITMTAGAALSSFSVVTTPHVAVVVSNSSWPAHPLGYPLAYLVRVKIAGGETTTLKLEVATTTSTSLSICGIKVSRSGDGYSCGVDLNTTATITDDDFALGINRKGSLDIGVVRNTGTKTIVTTDTFDENTVEFEVMVSMTPLAASAAEGSTHDLTLTVTYDTSPRTEVVTHTITATHDTSFVGEPAMVGSLNANAQIVGISANGTLMDNETLTEIALGESKRIFVDIVFPEDSITEDVTVTITAPTTTVSVMTVVYMGVVDAGANLPCTTRMQNTFTVSKKTSSDTDDVGTMTFPYVCNVGVNQGADVNRLRVEGIVRLLPTAQVNVGDKLDISVAVSMNDNEIGVYLTNLTVSNMNQYIDIYPDTITFPSDVGILETSDLSSLSMGIGEVKAIPITFVVPTFTSSRVTLDAVTPYKDAERASVTILDASITSNGANLPDLTSKDTVTIVSASHFNTSQMTKTEMDLGIVSNLAHNERLGQNNDEDSYFNVTFTVQMGDSVNNTDSSSVLLSFGLRVAKFIFILEVPITVSRTGSEALVFNVSSSVDEVASNSTYVVVDSFVNLDNTSTLEGQDTSLFYFLPPYVMFREAQMMKPYKEFVKIDTSRKSVVEFQLGYLYFSDDIQINVHLEANSSYKVPPGVNGIDSVLKYQVVTDLFDATTVNSDLEYVNFTVNTETETGTDCTPINLGMTSSSKVKDCQITSSRDTVVGFEAHKGRYNAGTAWTPFVHTGQVRAERYLQVFWGNKTRVTHVILQQDGAKALATSITIRHSDDGVAWVEDSDNVIAVTSATEQNLAVPAPRATRYIRVMMTELNDNTQQGAFRFEFQGCYESNDAPADMCSGTTTVTQLADFKSRTFLSVSDAVYVCDGRQGNLKIEQRCFFSIDGSNWAEMDPRVGSLLGYDSEEERVYGVSSDGLVYMSAKHVDGSQWETSVPDDITKVKAVLTYKAAKEVPLDYDTKLNTGDPHADFTDGSYGATSVGVKKNSGGWSTVFQWSQCCP